MSSLGTFWLPLFGGAQKLNIRSAPLICGSGSPKIWEIELSRPSG